MTISKELMLQMYRYMVLGRLFEQHAEQLTHKGLIPGAFHTGIGEEATHVGACLALTQEDYIIPTHRGHVADIIKGADPRAVDGRDFGPGNRLLWWSWWKRSHSRRRFQQPWRAGGPFGRISGCGRCSAHAEACQYRAYRPGHVW